MSRSSSCARRPACRAAGVPLAVEFGVRNFGQVAVRDVVINVETTAGSEGGQSSDAASWSKLPAIKIDAIKPGETATRRFFVRFATAGPHVLRATLEGISCRPTTAWRMTTFDMPLRRLRSIRSVLVIDGNPQDDDARIVTTALQPGGTIRDRT